jgi:transcriptional regulator with XRE-family HTH domain
MLKACRQARKLRQLDVGARLGRDQALVSKVESGERRLDVIELRTWLSAIDANFVAFVAELDERIRRGEVMKSSVFPNAQATATGRAPRKAGRVRRSRRSPVRRRNRSA